MTEEYHRSMVFSIHRFIMRLRSNERMIHYYTDDAVMSQKQPEVAEAMGRLTEGMF